MWVSKIDNGVPRNFGRVELSRSQSASSEEVEIGTLDGMFGDSSCALLKIEFEGMEEDAILGDRDVIKTNNPIIYVENDRLGKSKALIALVLDLNYRLWWHVQPFFNPNIFFGNREKSTSI